MLRLSKLAAAVSLLVDNYDQAIRFYTQALRFDLVEDSELAPGKRWVRVAPAGGGTALLLARAATPEQRALVGGQGAGRVWLFLQTDDFDGELAHFRAHGVRLVEEPRREAYGRVVVFLDLYGNRWDLIEPPQVRT